MFRVAGERERNSPVQFWIVLSLEVDVQAVRSLDRSDRSVSMHSPHLPPSYLKVFLVDSNFIPDVGRVSSYSGQIPCSQLVRHIVVGSYVGVRNYSKEQT